MACQNVKTVTADNFKTQVLDSQNLAPVDF